MATNGYSLDEPLPIFDVIVDDEALAFFSEILATMWHSRYKRTLGSFVEILEKRLPAYNWKPIDHSEEELCYNIPEQVVDIEKFSDWQRMILWMYYIEEMSVWTISKYTSTSRSDINVLIRQCTEELI